eukprot:TRINITY_DN96_c0_g1_i4.p1 TRINITY_DN96_c0_g1~~TRINITY_DN96_c0_g1_i4.p1  ORF type:complete len:316 (+),score=125.41 TRINITY_DN96_c0_g1_i4:93-1040(+)
MVDASIIAGGAVVFFVLLAVILYGSRGTETVKPKKERKQRPEKKDNSKDKKAKRNAAQGSKKNERVEEPQFQTRTKAAIAADKRQEDRDLEEFLKGRDKQEIIKTLQAEEKRATKNSKKKTEEVAPEIGRSHQISQKEADQHFQEVKQKPKKDKKEKKDKEETDDAQPEKKKGNKKYLKSEIAAQEQEKAEREAQRAKDKADYEERVAKREARKKLEEERAAAIARGETPPEIPREPRKPREKKEGEENRPRRYRQAEDGNGGDEERQQQNRLPSFDEVERSTAKYEAADIGDLLNMFSQGPARGSQKSVESKDQ